MVTPTSGSPGARALFSARPRWLGGAGRQTTTPYPFGLRTHLFIIVLVAVLPTLLVAILVGASATRMSAAIQHERLNDSARAFAGAVDQDLETMQTALAQLANSDGIEEGGDLRAFYARARQIDEIYGSRVALRRGDGVQVMNSRLPFGEVQRNMPVTSEAARVFASGRPSLTDVRIGRASGLPQAQIIVPAMHHGSIVATLDMVVSSDHLTAALRHQSRQMGGLAVVVDRTGRIAAASHDVARLAGQLVPLQDSPSPPHGPTPNAGWLGHGPAARAALLRAPGWEVIYTEVPSPGAPLSDHSLRAALLAAILAATVSLGLAAALSSRLTRPLRALTDQARAVAIGGQRAGESMPPSAITEFEALRQGMMRADAVLRRRGAAERMALREARTGHELLVSVVNGTAESIYVKDLELRYVLVNRAALLSGPVPRAEWQVLGRGSADLFPPIVARRIEAADRTVLATGRMTSFEQEYNADPSTTPGKPGAMRWVSMTIAPWQDADGRVVGVVSVSRDITQQRAADARMRTMQADLLRATRLSSMGAMASGLAHELNQPLAAATNYLNAGGRLLERGALGDTVAFNAARGAVADAAEQMLRAGAIVRRLRDFVARGEAELQPHDVGDLLREACDLARNDGVTTGLELRVEVASDARLALVDRTQIQQVLLNLIRNAAEAIGAAQGTETMQRPVRGEIVVTARLTPSCEMVITVSDNGPGLTSDVAEHLFEPFVSTKPTGMGIGLAICRTIIEGHGGELTAERNEMGGMLFRIVLPTMNLSGDPS